MLTGEQATIEKVAFLSLAVSVLVGVGVGALFVSGGSMLNQSVEAQIAQECTDSEAGQACEYTIEVTDFGGHDTLYLFANADATLTPSSPTQTVEGSPSESLRIYSVSEQPDVEGTVYQQEASYSIAPTVEEEEDDQQELSAPQYEFTREANPDGSGENITVSVENMNDATQIIVTSEGGSVNTSGEATVESNDFAEGGSVVRLYEQDAQVRLVGVPYNTNLTVEYVTENGRDVDRDITLTETTNEDGS